MIDKPDALLPCPHQVLFFDKVDLIHVCNDCGATIETERHQPPAPQDNLVEAAEDAVFGWLSVEEQADFLAFMAAHDAPIIAERDALLAEKAVHEKASQRTIDRLTRELKFEQTKHVDALAKLAAAEAREGVLRKALKALQLQVLQAPITWQNEEWVVEAKAMARAALAPEKNDAT